MGNEDYQRDCAYWYGYLCARGGKDGGTLSPRGIQGSLFRSEKERHDACHKSDFINLPERSLGVRDGSMDERMGAANPVRGWDARPDIAVEGDLVTFITLVPGYAQIWIDDPFRVIEGNHYLWQNGMWEYVK